MAGAPSIGASPHHKLGQFDSKWPTGGHLSWQKSADFANVSIFWGEDFIMH